MSTTIVGLVQGIQKGKPYTANVGPQAGNQLVTHTITIDTDEGSVKVQKNTLLTTNFSIATGTKVQVTYDTVQQGTFTNNKIAKDGLLILQDDGTPTQVTSTGQPKPAYIPGGVASKTTSTGVASIGGSSGGFQKSSYSSEGARNGMIVNASLALATARSKGGGEITLSSLKEAADDIKALTEYVETPQGNKASPKAQIEAKAEAKKETLKKAPGKSAQVQAINDFDEEDDSPFDQD